MKQTFAPELLEPAPSLSSVLAKKLRAEIESHRLRVGERFPTDAEIAKGYGVSRTVVREAVASLREAGLISTQRGRGSVVIAHQPSPTFSVTGNELESSLRLLQLYEFRAQIEAEVAAMAAQRRSDADVVAIHDCLKQGDRADTFEAAVDADIAFHVALAAATRNEYFVRLMATIRTATTARALLRDDLDESGYVGLFHSVIQPEHKSIADAIVAGSAGEARKLIRRHLGGRRYRELLRRVGGEDAPQPEQADERND